MSTSNDSFQPSSDGSLTAEEESILMFAVGERACEESNSSQWIRYLALALIGTLFFILLSLQLVDDWMSQYVPNYGHRILAKAVIFFVLLYLADYAIHYWQPKPANVVDRCHY